MTPKPMTAERRADLLNVLRDCNGDSLSMIRSDELLWLLEYHSTAHTIIQEALSDLECIQGEPTGLGSLEGAFSAKRVLSDGHYYMLGTEVTRCRHCGQIPGWCACAMEG